jgi:orotidine-5'-phosphate decarboxylase
MTGFAERLRRALDAHGPLCVGIDPHAHLLAEWGLSDSAAGTREFALRTIDAAAGAVAAVKPQVAFFERYGAAGFAVLEEVIATGRDAGLLMIADAKRGDIGSTMAAYADAWLRPGSPLESDAVTTSPYLGADALRDTLTSAVRHGKGVFVLAATSNPEALALQSAQPVDVAATDGQTIAARVARDVTWVNGSAAFTGGLGPVGVVIGATVDRLALGLTDDLLAGAPILAPGFGAQGAEPAELRALFGAVAGNVLASESRSLLSGGPDTLAARIRERAGRYREAMGQGALS